jgi:hypothetical protein
MSRHSEAMQMMRSARNSKEFADAIVFFRDVAIDAERARIVRAVEKREGPWPDNPAQWARDLVYRADIIAIVERRAG